MTTNEAFDKLYRDHRRVEALLTLITDYCESVNLDPTIVLSIDIIRDVMQSDREAFDILDQYIEQQMCRTADIVPIE